MRSNAHTNNSARQQRPNTLRLGPIRLGRTLGIAMVLAGAVLLTLASGYYAYSASARSQLEELNFVVAQPTQAALAIPPEPSRATAANPTESAAVPHSASVRGSVRALSPIDAKEPVEPLIPAEHANQQVSARPAESYSTLYPAIYIHPKFWAQPLWAGGEQYVYNPASPDATLPDGFRAVSAMDDALRRGDGSLTSRIAIPLIDVDSEIQELEILNLGDSRAYETPKRLVGHIPQSPNPGELGNAWYFGHLESPIKGEGNVFHRLPEIPELLRDGDDVFVELESIDGRIFLYKTTRTAVMHEDDLELYGSDTAQITLVACVPRLVYDHRIVVTAELVGIKDASGAVN